MVYFICSEMGKMDRHSGLSLMASTSLLFACFGDQKSGTALMQRLKQEVFEIAWLAAVVSGLCLFGALAGVGFAMAFFPQ